MASFELMIHSGAVVEEWTDQPLLAGQFQRNNPALKSMKQIRAREGDTVEIWAVSPGTTTPIADADLGGGFFVWSWGERAHYPVPSQRLCTAAAMTGSPTDVDFDGVANTIRRNTGDFLADGFVGGVGQKAIVSGTTSNNGTTDVIVEADTRVLRVASGIITEANVNAPAIPADGFSSKMSFIAQWGHWLLVARLDGGGGVCMPIFGVLVDT